MASVSEVLKTLAHWAEDCGGKLCDVLALEGKPCSHERARSALVEINNAVADIESRESRAGLTK